MKNLLVLPDRLWTSCHVAGFVVSLLSAGTLSGAELYNLDFSGAETGAYQIVAGSPTIQSSAGSLNDVLVFHATVGGDQIRLPVGVAGARYELQYDLLAHNLLASDYAFVLRLDTAGVRSLNFHGGLDSIYAYQSSPFVNQILAPFVNDTVYHIGVSLDLQADVWSVAIDGTPVCTNPLNGASLQAVRFGLAPWITGAVDAPGTYVALDNVVLNVIPEPSSVTLAVTGWLVWLGGARAKFRT
jgi:hypothetical protein